MSNPYYSYYLSYIDQYQSYETLDPYYTYFQTSATPDSTTSTSSSTRRRTRNPSRTTTSDTIASSSVASEYDSSTSDTSSTLSYPTSTYDAVIITTSDAPSISTLPSSSPSSSTPSSTTPPSTTPSSSIPSSTFVPLTTQATPQVTLQTSPSSTAAVAGTATAGAAAALATPSNVSHYHQGISGGAIAAAVVVPLIVVGLALLGLFFFFRRRSRNAASRASSFDGTGGAGGVMSEKNEAPPRYPSSGGHWQDADSVMAAAIPAPTRQQMIDFDARGQMLEAPAAAELAASRSVRSFGHDSQRAGAASRMSTRSRPSISTIRTTASTVMPHPPVLPPVDTSFNFSRSIGSEDPTLTHPSIPTATPQSAWEAAVAAGAAGGIAGAARLRRDNSNSAESTSSSHRDPFATPSPSSAHTRSNSSVLTRSESDVSRAGRRYVGDDAGSVPTVPVFSFSRSSPTLLPSSSYSPQPTAGAAPLRPSLAPADRTNTNSSFKSSEFSGTDGELDDVDGEIVESGAVAEAIMVRRAQVGERTRASVVELAGHSRQGSAANAGARKGSGGSEGSGIGMAQ